MNSFFQSLFGVPIDAPPDIARPIPEPAPTLTPHDEAQARLALSAFHIANERFYQRMAHLNARPDGIDISAAAAIDAGKLARRAFPGAEKYLSSVYSAGEITKFAALASAAKSNSTPKNMLTLEDAFKAVGDQKRTMDTVAERLAAGSI